MVPALSKHRRGEVNRAVHFHSSKTSEALGSTHWRGMKRMKSPLSITPGMFSMRPS